MTDVETICDKLRSAEADLEIAINNQHMLSSEKGLALRTLDIALNMLLRVEWIGEFGCLWCGCPEDEGHARDCELQALRTRRRAMAQGYTPDRIAALEEENKRLKIRLEKAEAEVAILWNAVGPE